MSTPTPAAPPAHPADPAAVLRVPEPRRAAEPLRVASVPAGHVYVRHLSREVGPAPHRLPDPEPPGVNRYAGAEWWPPVMLDPAWVRDADIDLMHVHFGFDGCEPETLREVARTLRGRGIPLVLTVHDLRNPHHEDRSVHDAQLDVLVPAADALLTLTPGAAAEVRRRWGREATVVPHPHVVPFRTMAVAQDCRARRRVGAVRVGLHVKSLRASMDPGAVLPVLARTVAELPGAVLQVNGHRELLEPDGAHHDADLAALLRAEQAAGRIDLRVHDFLGDDAFFAYLGSLDVSVLPYRFGTHSGWLEACRDLGTTVVAPTCGYFAEQGPVLTYGHDEHGLDADSLADAVRTAVLERPALGATIDERRAQRALVADVHDGVYAAVVSARRGG